MILVKKKIKLDGLMINVYNFLPYYEIASSMNYLNPA